MISVYKNANKEKKQYKVKGVKTGTTKNGGAYTSFRITDSKLNQETKQWNSQIYNVFVWSNLDLKDEDFIEFNEILSIECEEKEWQGQKRIERTIFADVKPILSDSRTQSRSAEAKLTELDVENDDAFPF